MITVVVSEEPLLPNLASIHDCLVFKERCLTHLEHIKIHPFGIDVDLRQGEIYIEPIPRSCPVLNKWVGLAKGRRHT